MSEVLSSVRDPEKSDKLLFLPDDALNAETPLDQVEGTIVPASLFFLRSNHAPPPKIDPTQWRLEVHGLVHRPVETTLGDLRRMTVRKLECWLECAGNSRSRFQPPAEGNQWNNEAVGNAEFTGVSLSEVLARAGGVKSGAVDVVTTGADADTFQRGMPLADAMNPDVMLVWEMNGQAIPHQNGGPVRLLVPGWGGIASVKWPKRIEVIDRPFDGYWNRDRYVMINPEGTVLGPVRAMPVKSVIAAPRADTTVERAPQKAFGFAWSGFGRIAAVEVSMDGGATWTPARLIHGDGPRAWTRWEHEWTPSQPGAARLASRATDEKGNVQPSEALRNKFGYQMNAVEVRTIQVA